VFAPMPRASVSTATAVKAGFFRRWRKANLRSFIFSCQWSVVRCPSSVDLCVHCALPIPNSTFESFISQCDHRIDFGSPTRRDVTREKCNATEQERNRDEGHRISRSHSEQQRGKESGQSQCTGDAKDNSDRGQ